MNDAIANFAAGVIRQRMGVAVEAQIVQGQPPVLNITPLDAHPNDAFTIRFIPGWRTAEVDFIPGRFAAPLVAQMGKAASEGRSVLAAFASALQMRKAKLIFRVNGVDISPFNSEDWPLEWNRIELHARSTPQVIEPGDIAQMHQLVIDLVVPIFGIVTALIGVEEPEAPVMGETEGTPYQTLVTRYERKKVSREACIQLKGLRCAACGFDFADFYGQMGAGYIEIHHTTPVSQLGPDYRINVAMDLEPLCANCHAMVHRRTPPLAIQDLVALIADRNMV